MQKGFIQIPVLIAIVVGVLVLGAGGYWGVIQYQDYQVKKDMEVRLTEENRKAGEEQRLKLEELFELQNKELEKQKLEIEDIKKESNLIIQNIKQKANTPATSEVKLSRSEIIEQWAPNIAQITCSFDLDKIEKTGKIKNYLNSYGVDTRPTAASGSGLLYSINSAEGPAIALITNKHVIRAHNGFSVAYYCEAILPGNHKYSFALNDVYSSDGIELGLGIEEEIKFYDGKPFMTTGIDSGWLWIRNPDLYTTNLAKSPKNAKCTSQPRIGDDVIALGYPSVGSTQGITVTEGIISGIEELYYVTSAKIERGNSGGAAILIEKNCYIGIPTFAITGSIESLARILNLKGIFK